MNEPRGPLPYSLDSDQGEAWWWLGSLTTIKATGEQTDGAYTLVEVLEAEGVEAPLHVHHREDEGFWVLEGRVTFRVGEQTIEAGPGTFVFGPRDVPHAYRVDEGPARMLFIFSPAGMEGFIRSTSIPAESLTIPEGAEEAFDEEQMEELARVAAEYGAEILG